jgi:hypothetical protein
MPPTTTGEQFILLANKENTVMDTDNNNQDVTIDANNGGEGNGNEAAQEFKLSKAEYEELVGYKSTVGSLKRELKDLKKSSEGNGQGNKETPKTNTEEFGLLHKSFLRAAGITAEDEVDLAREVSKKWGMDIDKLVDDEDFKGKLQKVRDAKANAAAVDVRGGSSSSSGAKNTPQYWIQKGTPPTPNDIADRKTRASIIRAMADHGKNAGGKFYNE